MMANIHSFLMRHARPSLVITNYHKMKQFPGRYNNVEWAGDYFDLGLTLIHFRQKYAQNDITFSFSVTLTFDL